MKLVTFDSGGSQHVGRLEDGEVVELDVPSLRAYFERGGTAEETGKRFAVNDVVLRAPSSRRSSSTRPGTFASTTRSR